MIARVEADLAPLEEMGRRLEGTEFPAEHRGLATHQLATLDYGIGSNRFALDWLRTHLARHEQGSPKQSQGERES